MGFFYLFTSILMESAGKTVDKLNFKRSRISPRLMTWLVFLVMTVSLGIFIALVNAPFPILGTSALGLLALIALFSFGDNVFDVLSLKRNDLSLREPLVDFQPIAAGLVGYLLFPEQRKTAYLIAFIVGFFVVRWGISRRKLNKTQRQGMVYLWIGVAMYAVQPAIYQEALQYISPSYLALFRVSSVFILVTLFFKPPSIIKEMNLKRLSYTSVSGIFYAIGAVVSLYAIQTYGVTLTMLFLILGPSLRFLASYFILKEKVRKGEVISSLMLALIVALAAFAK